MKPCIQRFTRHIAGLAVSLFLLACGIAFLHAADPEPGELWVTSQGAHRLFIVHGGASRSRRYNSRAARGRTSRRSHPAVSLRMFRAWVTAICSSSAPTTVR